MMYDIRGRCGLSLALLTHVYFFVFDDTADFGGRRYVIRLGFGIDGDEALIRKPVPFIS